MQTPRSPAIKVFLVMIVFIINDPACLNLSASQKYSVNHLRGVKKPDESSSSLFLSVKSDKKEMNSLNGSMKLIALNLFLMLFFTGCKRHDCDSYVVFFFSSR